MTTIKAEDADLVARLTKARSIVRDECGDIPLYVRTCIEAALADASERILASHADPLRRALERINELSVTPISGDHAAANNGKELIRAKAIARQALDLAALSSGENNNGE